MDNISDRNPDLDEMEARGWAWLQRSLTASGNYKHGAPYTEDEYAKQAVKRLHEESEGSVQTQELIIVSWE